MTTVYAYGLAPLKSRYWQKHDATIRELASIGLSHSIIAAELHLGGNGERKIKKRIRELNIEQRPDL